MAGFDLSGTNKKQIDKLKLPLMSQINRSRMQTALLYQLKQRKVFQQEYPFLIEQKQLRLQS